ncbi:MAG: hypothetical protein V4631_10610 [Pseudomonadota bacterium]
MMSRTLNLLGALLVAATMAACGGGGGRAATAPPVAPVPADPATLSVLMFGNSHTVLNNLPGMLSAMLTAGRPGKTFSVVAAPGYLTLEERRHDAASLALMSRQKWSAIVFQAQQYSLSGDFVYSIDEAVDLVRMTRLAGTVPVMFPEWPRFGVDETERIFDLHVSIARLQAACVAPIPQAFDRAALQYPTLVLHNVDGNHSSPAGAFLAALVLYATLTGNSAGALPLLPAFAIDGATQARLRAVADEQMLATPPRTWCPGDVVL